VVLFAVAVVVFLCLGHDGVESGDFVCMVGTAWELDICGGWDSAGIALSYFLGDGG